MPDHQRVPAKGLLTEEELSALWREYSRKYASAINGFVRHGMSVGWNGIGAKDEPEETRQELAPMVLGLIRKANAEGETSRLREKFPPAYTPFMGLVSEHVQCVSRALLLDNGRIVVRVGAPYEDSALYIISGQSTERMSPDIITVGRSPDRRYFAVARTSGVTIHQGWSGRKTSRLSWPPEVEVCSTAEEGKSLPAIEELVPFGAGDRALLVASKGVFVLFPNESVRLLPTDAERAEKDDPDGTNLSMAHGAVSLDGKWIATGHQSSRHLVFDAESLEVAGDIGNQSEYPHYAAFSADGSMIALNSCHFYAGITLGVPTRLLPGLSIEAYELDPRTVELDGEARVYAAVTRADEFIVGDANGYVRAFDLKGNFRWRHFIGGTVSALDISPDGKFLVVGTYGGILSLVDLDTGEPDPFAIGTSTHRDRQWWLFWRNEQTPLAW